MQALGVLAAIGYFLMGLVQLAAIWSGLEAWLGLSGVLGFFGALILAYFPIIGAILGMYGAVTLWGWSWLAAGALFFWPLVIAVIAGLVSALSQ